MIDVGHELITASYIWRPDRREIDALMLSAGCDPSEPAYFDDAGRILKRLYGLEISYFVVAEFETASLPALVKSAAASGHDPAAAGSLWAIEVANAGIKKGLLESALAGTLDGHKSVSLGEYRLKVEL